VTGRQARVTALRVVGAVMATAGAVAVLGGAALVAADLSSHTDEWDGLMVFFGMMLAVPGLMLVLAGVTVTRSARRGTATSALVTGVVGGLTVIVAANQGDAFGLGLTTPLLVVGLVLVAVAAACGRAREQPIDSPGGISR
jgi:peptidoglycan/LPS O-acetylase OafA/YrhL